MRGALYIGLSGWSYDDWKNKFYAGVARKNWLTHYAGLFNSVEINATFYGRQRDSTLEKWYAAVPDSFRFAVKAHRYVTHVKRLSVDAESIVKARAQCAPLVDKASAMLWQFPANFAKNIDRLARFASLLDEGFPDLPHCMEFRHTSWFDDEVRELLKEHGLSHVISDAADWPLWDAVTANPAYVRLHGHDETYRSAYTSAQLAEYADKVHGWLDSGLDVHVYFDNTEFGKAPDDALRFKKMLEHA
jgi:uncharacterized protein YecE (DUF72 family)